MFTTILKLTKTACILVLAAGTVLAGCDSTNKPEAVDLESYKQVYANPFPILDQEWEDYGMGDPYVLRHDGRYYLYVSTKDFRVGIKAWVSDNLIDWTYAGLVTEDPVSTGAYAPEVVYWNGFFYLYTSPAGKGHYVFRSESPTGPFERITDNLGMSIDGSVFIDDDGSWTFTHAGTGGIVGVPMEGPASFGFGQTIPGTFLGHWTEGSMIIKRGGTYYLTNTGNHVFSKGYRIHYAVSKESPLGPYTMPANNPLVISTDPDFNGLGHSSTVMGPDLDSYYLVYHNLVGRSAEGPPVRQMNIDRLVFNGDRMEVLGPTHYAQPVPKLADFHDRLDAESIDMHKWEQHKSQTDSLLISKEQTRTVFTAEYNVRNLPLVPASAKAGAVFSYSDDAHYGLLEIDTDARELRLNLVTKGESSTLASTDLSPELDWSKLHTFRVERGEERIKIYLDGGLKLETDAASFGAGSIGYRYGVNHHDEPALSYTAFTNEAGGSSDFETAKPLPGAIEAVHYLSGADRGFNVKEHADSAAFRKLDGTDIRLTEDGSYSVALHEKGDWLRYAVNVSESGIYALDLTVKTGESVSAVEALVDDISVQAFEVATERYARLADWAKIRIGKLQLDKGFHTLTIRLKKGEIELKTIEFEQSNDDTSYRTENVLEQAGSDDMHGSWQSTESGYSGDANEDAKMYGGSPIWSDYRIKTSVRLGEDPSGQAGVLFRVTNESDFRDQVKDSFMGYFLAISSNKIELYKHNYDSVLIHAEKVKLERGVSIPLRIEVIGGSISIFVKDESKPVFEYLDPNAFMQGRVGIRSVLAEQIELGDLTVESMEAD